MLALVLCLIVTFEVDINKYAGERDWNNKLLAAFMVNGSVKCHINIHTFYCLFRFTQISQQSYEDPQENLLQLLKHYSLQANALSDSQQTASKL